MAKKRAVKLEEGVNHEIEVITGEEKVLFVSPYGHKDDDQNTGELTRRMAENMGCYALINKEYRRPNKETEIETAEGKEKSKEQPDKAQKVIDLCDVKQVEKNLSEEFLDRFLSLKDEITEKHGHALIVWMQGAGDEDFKKEIKETEDVKPEDFKVLVGWGQRPKKKADTEQDRLTAKKETVDSLVEALNINDLPAVLSSTDVDTNRYRGWVQNNMNQLFLDGKYRDQKVQSIQLEIRKNGCLEKEGLETTAKNLEEAIIYVTDKMSAENSLMNDSKDELVEKVFEHLKSVYTKKISDDMLEAGKYIIENLYGNNYKEAKGKRYDQTQSMARLIRKIQDDTEGNCPSRTWIYNSVNLAIDNNSYENNELPAEYESLGHSHKIKLLYVKNPKTKEALIKETAEKKYTVAKLLERIKEEENKGFIPVDQEIPEDKLESLKSEEIKKLKERIVTLKENIERNLATCKANLQKVNTYMNKNKNPVPEEKKIAA